MSKPADDLSALFRSLRPDDTSFQSAETVAVREAAQRWPLFQAVSPRKPATTPMLSAQERQRWSHQDQVAAGERKPALSLPGLSDKISRSLGKMSGRAVDAPIRSPARRAEPDTPPVASRSQRSAPQVTTQASRSASFSATPTAVQNLESEGSDLGLFRSAVGGPKAAKHAASAVAPADDSLAGVFSRLEGTPQELHTPTDKKSSFLNRLGKR